MARAAEEHGDNPLFALERGEITEATSGGASSGTWTDGFDLTRLRELSSSGC